jgi:hypothetical protein
MTYNTRSNHEVHVFDSDPTVAYIHAIHGWLKVNLLLIEIGDTIQKVAI